MNNYNDPLFQRITVERSLFDKLVEFWNIINFGIKYGDDKCYIEKDNKNLDMCEYRMIGGGYCYLFREDVYGEEGYLEDNYSRCNKCIEVLGMDESNNEGEEQ